MWDLPHFLGSINEAGAGEVSSSRNGMLWMIEFAWILMLFLSQVQKDNVDQGFQIFSLFSLGVLGLVIDKVVIFLVFDVKRGKMETKG